MGKKKSNKKGIVIALGLGVGGYALYKYMNKDEPGAAPPPSSSPGVPVGPVALPPPALVPLPTDFKSNLSPTPGLPPTANANVAPNTQTGSNTAAISAPVLATVQAWVTADGKAPSTALALAKIPSEYNGMAAIITGGWNPTDDQRVFWNAIVNKYDPQRKYW